MSDTTGNSDKKRSSMPNFFIGCGIFLAFNTAVDLIVPYTAPSINKDDITLKCKNREVSNIQTKRAEKQNAYIKGNLSPKETVSKNGDIILTYPSINSVFQTNVTVAKRNIDDCVSKNIDVIKDVIKDKKASRYEYPILAGSASAALLLVGFWARRKDKIELEKSEERVSNSTINSPSA